ncbi:uncharacterized protein [Watersipora subatra]|uniref:uncharacterized protein n=1 Tax=Watersipora subatra TaxID=2589382 RepID=UPI00355BC69D
MDLQTSILNALIINYGIIAVAWVVAVILQTEKFFDLTATGTLVFLTCKSLQWGEAQYPRQYIQSACAVLWAIRLGSFLTIRVWRKGSEKGFDGVRDHPFKFLAAWIMLGVWTTCNIAPTFIQNIKTAKEPIGPLEYIGWSAWCIGFVTEWVADHQKTIFKSLPQNEDKFITEGLWRLCRHPNYFGESLMWTGLYLSAWSVLEGWEHLSIISPLFITLLTSQATGRQQEKQNMAKWGNDPKYLQYLSDTPYYIPSIFKVT